MGTYGTTRGRGFTLVELLAAIAIIGLLIGLLVPAVSRVRDQAKRASVQNLHATLAKGCHAFNAELGKYPISQGFNPFESSQVPLSGAQWLVLQLAGADLKGFVKQSKDKYYDLQNPPNGINHDDWNAWYDPDDEEYNDRRRFGPYVPLDGKIAQTPTQLAESLGTELPQALTQGSSDFSNAKLPLAVDAYEFPVLYYVANPQAKRAFTDWSTNDRIGRYDPTDNWQITGTNNGATQSGWDLGGGPVTGDGEFHWFWEFGVTGQPEVFKPNPPVAKSFALSVYDDAAYQQNQRIWPRNPDSFIFVSPGKDAIFGTGDDITNF